MRASKFKLANRRRVRLLDVGCGGGTLLGLLQHQGLDVLGFDTAPEAADIAKTQSGVDIATGARLHDSEFADASFDMVSLFHVMEHVPDPRNLLAEVRRILCHGGKVVLQVPNIESWQSRICGTRWHGLDVPRHVINYSTESVQRLLVDFGFRIVRVRHFNLRDNAPAFASSLFPALDPGRRRVRQSRGNTGELSLLTWAKHALYLAAVAAVLPFAIAESLAGCGATLMVEAEKV
ncbi:MAG TPA: class I SAM-dependent methyltransferase [Terriglobia bacterium]|nr:class I SAM-dependent methyltransferase [Terriglobia bacterium]